MPCPYRKIFWFYRLGSYHEPVEFLLAKLNLFWNLIVHLIKKPFLRRRSGYRQFLENYRSDRLIPLTSTDRDWILKFSRCLNCGLCDAVCPALLTLPREKFPGPSYIVTPLARATPDFWAVDIELAMCQGCELCQQVCPNQVPVKEALEFIEVKTAESSTMRRSR